MVRLREPLRAALGEAIAKRDELSAEKNRLQDSPWRVKSDARAKLRAAQEWLETAKAESARVMAAGDAVEAGAMLRCARTAVAEAEDELEAAGAASGILEKRLRGVDAELERAEKAIDVAAFAVFQAAIGHDALLEELEAVQRRMAEILAPLVWIARLDQSPTPPAVLRVWDVTKPTPELPGWRQALEALKRDADAPVPR